MIRTKLILVFGINLLLIICLLSLHMSATNKEIYRQQRLEWMHHEYITILNIRHAVSVQVKETLNGVVLGFELTDEKYTAAKEMTEQAFAELFGTITSEMEYVFTDEDKAHEEEENSKAMVLRRLYDEISKKLELASQVQGSVHAEEVRQSLIEVDRMFAQFSALSEDWIEHEQEEILEMEKTFAEMNQRNTYILGIGSLVTILLVLIMSLSILRIIGPRLEELLKGTKRVANGNLETPVVLKGNDEFTHLSGSFNLMMDNLRDYQKRLLEQSYYSGMADMVAGILHNVKNSFSPFVIDSEIIRRHIENIKLSQLQQAIGELSGKETNESRRKDLNDLISLILENSSELLAKVTDKLSDMQSRASLVERIMEDQSRFAQAQRPMEVIPLDELIRDSLSLVKKDFLDRVPVRIDETVLGIGSVKTQRIVLMQVFSNVIINGIESILRKGQDGGKVILRALLEQEEDQEFIHLIISDNGEGLEEEQLQDIFQRGISNKAKRSGLGLHWCANSITALQGRLYAESEGLGKGACFHLILKRDV